MARHVSDLFPYVAFGTHARGHHHPSTMSVWDNPRPRQLRGTPISYHGKRILAPMGSLPLRLLALQYGADLVYSPELIDKKLSQTERSINASTGCVEYVLHEPNRPSVVIWRSHPDEMDHCVLQMGTASSDTALAAALHVVRDVDAIDVNMGCPKSFSISGGMGAALLTKPDVAEDILRTLRQALPADVAVTCKVRLLESPKHTIDFVRRMASTGINAIAIHARTTPQRPREPAEWSHLRTVCEHANLDIPIILNGDVFTHTDFQRARTATGCDAVMVARGAMWNPSIFSPTTQPLGDVMKRYVALASSVGNHFVNTKFVTQSMAITSHPRARTRAAKQWGQRVIQSKSYAQLITMMDDPDFHTTFDAPWRPITAPGNGTTSESANASAVGHRRSRSTGGGDGGDSTQTHGGNSSGDRASGCRGNGSSGNGYSGDDPNNTEPPTECTDVQASRPMKKHCS